MKNEYEIRGEVTAIFLKRKDGTRLETLISTSDLNKANEFAGSWYACWAKNTKTFYVHGQGLLLHRFLFDNPKGYVIDHIDHDTLNNIRTNLRVITNSQNLQHRRAQRGSKTGIRGVYFNEENRKWRAMVNSDGKIKHLGYFDDIKLAEQVVIEARKKYLPFSIEG